MLDKGTKVAGYEIEGILGHGGMGVVYEARQLSLGRTVALKILAGTLGMDPSFKERFRHEGRIQAALDHPHIVTIFEAGEWDDSLFIAMRLVRGPNLKEMIIARELEGARTLRILRPIAEALDSAHEAGLIHRDIKPQNILVGSRDRAYLADFGLTKGIDDAGLTQTGQFVGTIDYIAPEQIRGEPATNACDIYALSAVLYECLTGAVPYPKPSDAAVMYAHLSEPPPLVTDQRPELPPNLDEVICKAMDKDPKARYASATDADRRGRAGARQARARGHHAARADRGARGGGHPREGGARPDPAGARPAAPRARPRSRAGARGADHAGRDAARRSLPPPRPRPPRPQPPPPRPRGPTPADPTVGRAGRAAGGVRGRALRSDRRVARRAPAGRRHRRLARGPARGLVAAPADATVASPAVRPHVRPGRRHGRLARGPAGGVALRGRAAAARSRPRRTRPRTSTSPPTVAMPAVDRGASAAAPAQSRGLRADRRWRGGRRRRPRPRPAAAERAQPPRASRGPSPRSRS